MCRVGCHSLYVGYTGAMWAVAAYVWSITDAIEAIADVDWDA